VPADYDSPWKEALAHYFRGLVELCFPTIAAAIDWQKGFEFLDTELHELLRGAAEGRQHVDKLVRVTLLDGQTQRILVHVEVQHWPDSNFPERLYSYHVRLREKGEPVVSVAIVADMDPRWKPSRYEHELLGCRVAFDFPTCKSELIRIDQEQQHMPYVTSIERLAREEGRQEGRQEGRYQGREEAVREMIVEYLRSRFGAVSQELIDKLQTSDLSALKSIQRHAWNSETIQEFTQFLHSLRKA
jgi:hypothetical protein